MDYKTIHEKAFVIDGHADIIYDLFNSRGQQILNALYTDEPVTWNRLRTCHIPTLKAGGVDLVIANIYADFHPESSLKQAILQLADFYEELPFAEDLKLVLTKKDLQDVKNSQKIGILLSMEGCEPLGNDVNMMNCFYHLGVRSAMLTWNCRNGFGCGTDDRGGLSIQGKELLQKMEQLGIIVDLSHLNEEGFWDAMEIVQKPVIASHSNARAIYDHPRNLTDAQIKAVVERGGVIGMNHMFTAASKDTTMETFMTNLDYMLDTAGEDHVGLGFDFCAYLGDPYVPDFEDASMIPNITEAMCKRNYSEETITKVLGGNFLRILENALE